MGPSDHTRRVGAPDGAALALPGLVPGTRYRLWLAERDFCSRQPVVCEFLRYAGSLVCFRDAAEVVDRDDGQRQVVRRFGALWVAAPQIRMIAEDLPPEGAP